MTKTKAFFFTITFLAVIFGVKAQSKSTETGFTSLFNGTNLEGWVGNKESYKAQDGMIVIDPQGGGGGNLYTEKEYGNFILHFEFKLTPGANNGLGIHAPLEGDAAYVGKELQILDNTADKYAELEVYQYHGSVYGVIPAKRGFLNPVGEWNQQTVIVNHPKIQVIVNGTTILEGDYLEASKDGTLDHKDHPGLERSSGHIGFLGHGDVVYFKDIRIKEL
ncbi:3-keto-disaccharide hydrolase [Algoriphagus yeomjeoni]|uniref:3-keto-disaccharide hydrolase n=1 Tax=Algoriphagus yeomjeoni TaxID=291403 RepID=UPI003CE48999